MDEKIPTETEVAHYEHQMKAFSWGFQQDVVTFLRTLHMRGIDINWAIKCILIKQKTVIINRKERARARADWQKKAKRCPRCNLVMFLGRVNDHPARMVGHKYKTQWICPNQPRTNDPSYKSYCGYVEYSKRTPAEWMKKLRISDKTLKKLPHPFLREVQFDFSTDILKEGDQDGVS